MSTFDEFCWRKLFVIPLFFFFLLNDPDCIVDEKRQELLGRKGLFSTHTGNESDVAISLAVGGLTGWIRVGR